MFVRRLGGGAPLDCDQKDRAPVILDLGPGTGTWTEGRLQTGGQNGAPPGEPQHQPRPWQLRFPVEFGRPGNAVSPHRWGRNCSTGVSEACAWRGLRRVQGPAAAASGLAGTDSPITYGLCQRTGQCPACAGADPSLRGPAGWPSPAGGALPRPVRDLPAPRTAGDRSRSWPGCCHSGSRLLLPDAVRLFR